jgi:hypothetical protein
MQTIDIVAHTENISQIEAIKAVLKALKIKFEIYKSKPKEKPYNAAFVSKIEHSREQAKKGKTVKVKLDDIWKK